ncbi:hypothetical protein [Actinoplanes sp. NPDC051851]|uniref:hypothetical protein n=1 Tax=Actinoplanes sp. NPDC051851 TaxID=3154753 RepID=UPI00342FA9C9
MTSRHPAAPGAATHPGGRPGDAASITHQKGPTTPMPAAQQPDNDRAARVHQHLDFRIEPAGLRLYIDNTGYRILVATPRRRRDLPALIPHLQHAAALGAVHGPCNQRAEIAATLAGRATPGCALYGRSPSGALTLDLNGAVTELDLPDLRPRYLTGDLLRALSDVFYLAGRIADDAETLPSTAR